MPRFIRDIFAKRAQKREEKTTNALFHMLRALLIYYVNGQFFMFDWVETKKNGIRERKVERICENFYHEVKVTPSSAVLVLHAGMSSTWTSVVNLLTPLEILIQGSNREERDCRPSTLYNLGFSFLAIFAPERWKREEEESNGITTRGMGRERDYTRHEIRLIN